MSYVRYNLEDGIDACLINDDGKLLEPWFFWINSYVAVYLDFITEDEKGVSYSFDFLTNYGLEAYLEYIKDSRVAHDLDIPNRIATYVQLKNIKDPLHVEEKQYYLLKLDSLDISRLSPEVSDLYLSVYNYEEKESTLPELIPLPGMKGILYNGTPIPAPQISTFPNGKLLLKVNNVGRGNWNEIIVRNKARVVYDMGTNIEKKSWNDVKSLADKHKYDSKPTLIISHWDLDHYNVFLFMSNSDRDQFSQLIVTSTLPSLTPFRMLQELVRNTKVKLSLVDNNPQILTAPVNYIDVKNPQLKLFACPMKMGVSKSYTNESGLLLDVDDKDKNILLTGDCTYEQANGAVVQSFATIKADKEHYLVVPHHGGGHKPRYNTPQHCIIKGVIISVDELTEDKTNKVVRHRYGHPTIEVVHHLIKDHHCILYRTDYMNDDITI